MNRQQLSVVLNGFRWMRMATIDHHGITNTEDGHARSFEIVSCMPPSSAQDMASGILDSGAREATPRSQLRQVENFPACSDDESHQCRAQSTWSEKFSLLDGEKTVLSFLLATLSSIERGRWGNTIQAQGLPFNFRIRKIAIYLIKNCSFPQVNGLIALHFWMVTVRRIWTLLSQHSIWYIINVILNNK